MQIIPQWVVIIAICVGCFTHKHKTRSNYCIYGRLVMFSQNTEIKRQKNKCQISPKSTGKFTFETSADKKSKNSLCFSVGWGSGNYISSLSFCIDNAIVSA